MKTKMLSVVSLFLLGASSLFAQVKTEKFEVGGSCGMCKTRIEKAAKSVDGVRTADWQQKSQQLTVSFDSTKTTVLNVHTAIAAVGHDTPLRKAKTEVYNQLPSCCKYDRSAIKKSATKKEMTGHEGHNH